MGKCAIINDECPRTNDRSARKFCPAWNEGIVWTNPAGMERVMNCAIEALMPTCVELIKASNRPAAAVESCRNEIANGFKGVTQALQQVAYGLPALPDSEQAHRP